MYAAALKLCPVLDIAIGNFSASYAWSSNRRVIRAHNIVSEFRVRGTHGTFALPGNGFVCDIPPSVPCTCPLYVQKVSTNYRLLHSTTSHGVPHLPGVGRRLC